MRKVPLHGIVNLESFILADSENHLDMLESMFPTLSGSAFAAAREQVLASGQSVLQSEQGYIYEVFPNGNRVPFKRTEPPTLVVSGSKITIR